MSEDFRPSKHTASGRDPELDTSKSVPTDKKLADGQYADHWALSEEDRKKDRVRPLRMNYEHVGIAGPNNPLRELTQDEHELYDQYGYVKFEQYPATANGLGKFWTQKELDKIDKGCGVTTTMPRACAETYAVNPSYYGSTFCCGCGEYFPVREFTWSGSKERVGS